MRKILFLILCSLFIGQVSFAQEVAKNRVFVLNSFEGGIATKLDDYSTDPKYARIAENVRLNTSLKAIAKRSQIYAYGTAVTATEYITGMHRLYLSGGTKKLIISQGNDIDLGNDSTGAFTSILALATADYRWKFLTWHDLAIGGDGYNQPMKYDGTTATYLGTCAGIDSAAGAGPVAGTYAYKVSFYTTSYEVIFDVASSAVVNGAGDHDVSLTMIPIGPDTYLGETVTGRKVYRNKLADQTHWFKLSNGTIANNTATILTDSDTDAELTATAYPAGTATWTPPKGKFYLIHQNRLFIANNPTTPSRVYYSKDSSHDLFEIGTDYFNIRPNDGDEITGLFNLLGILTIPKTNTWQKLYTNGDDPAGDWEISDPYSNIGCDAPYSAVSTPLGIMYLSKSKSGLYVFNGQSSILKSEKATPIIDDISSSNLNAVSGEYNNNVYYLAYASSSVGGSTNNRVAIYDMLSDSFTIDTLSISTFCSFTGGSDGGVLYGGSSTNGKVYQYGNTSKTVIHNKHSDFSGTFDDARYLPVSSAVGGDSNSPVLELSWDVTIDTYGVGTINAATGDVNRPDGSGTYISPVLSTTGASAYDKIYWNETLPAGCDATLAIRHGASAALCAAAAWSAEYSTAAESDISGLTAEDFTQYRITLSSADIDYTPNITTIGGFTTKLTYSTLGAAAETSIALHWQTGWLSFGVPTYKKSLRKIYVSHEGTNGTLKITVTNEYGDSDAFNINLATYPTTYEEYFTNGELLGRYFKVDIVNSDLNSITIKNIVLIYDCEPLI